jgi:hypothetical protein
VRSCGCDGDQARGRPQGGSQHHHWLGTCIMEGVRYAPMWRGWSAPGYGLPVIWFWPAAVLTIVEMGLLEAFGRPVESVRSCWHQSLSPTSSSVDGCRQWTTYLYHGGGDSSNSVPIDGAASFVATPSSRGPGPPPQASSHSRCLCFATATPSIPTINTVCPSKTSTQSVGFSCLCSSNHRMPAHVRH